MKKLTKFKKIIKNKNLFLGAFICMLLLVFTSCEEGTSSSNSTNGLAVSTPQSLSGASFNFFPSDAYNVPHDVPSAKDSTQLALSRFAWQEFIALNWPSSYNTTTHTRGKPDNSKLVNDFLSPDNNGRLVWQTYMHRVEMYPLDTTNYYKKSFNSAPKYVYKEEILGLNSTNPLKSIDTIFNNLDETSEINLCTLFVEGDPNAPGATSANKSKTASGLPGAPRRMIYEAKANRDMFDYVRNTKLYKKENREARKTYTEIQIKDHGKGAIYQPVPDPKMIVFPFGEIGGVEGSIEIKATWRQLTLKEYKTGRYLTAPILYYRGGTLAAPNPNGTPYYDVVPSAPTYTIVGTDSTLTSLPYGLVGLHIIHKTKTFPSYVFATFEQVDNLSTKEEPLNKLFYYNRNNDPGIAFGKQPVYTRSNPILPDTQKVNDSVHAQIKKLNPTSVWQYYKLIGVQGHPQNNANTTDYFLANIATETNAVLANFSGTLDTLRGTKNPKGINLYQGPNNKFIQGGCKGCHGNAQQSDFSFITQNAPIDFVDFINQPLLKPGQ